MYLEQVYISVRFADNMLGMKKTKSNQLISCHKVTANILQLMGSQPGSVEAKKKKTYGIRQTWHTDWRSMAQSS